MTLAEKLVWEIVPERFIRLAEPELSKHWFRSHTTYLVCDDKTGTKVRRRYNDFVWLHEMVLKILILILIGIF